MRPLLYSLITSIFLLISTSICQAEVILEDTHGQSIPFSSLKGKWVLINYWAGWCQTCLDEIPEFNRFYQKHKADAVALYAVNYDALPPFEQQSLIRRFNIRYPNLLNDPARQLHLGDITGVPVTFIFNPQGKLVSTLYGGQTAATLDKVIASN